MSGARTTHTAAPRRGAVDTLPRLRILAVVLPCLALLVLTALRHTLVVDRWPVHGHLVVDTVLVLATVVFALAMVAGIERRHGDSSRRARDLAAIDAVTTAARAPGTPDDVVVQCLRVVLDVTGAAHARLDTTAPLEPGGVRTTWRLGDEPDAPDTVVRVLPLTVDGAPVGTLTVTAEDAERPLTDDAHASIASTLALALHRARHLARLHHECHDAALAERDRIAREMHDSLAQALGAAHLRLHAIAARPDVTASPAAAHEIEDVAALCEEAYADVREAILGLRTTSDGRNRTLTQALDGYLRAYTRRTGIVATLHADTDAADALPPHHQNHVVRVVQEALTNVRKHAHADRVDVRITTPPGLVRVTVTDDGAGFDPARVAEGRFGLATMGERADLLDGHLTVDSAPGHGTRVTLDVPAARVPGALREHGPAVHARPVRASADRHPAPARPHTPIHV
ncbi:sensor histidine kinase [Mobilicoccus pelagius]|uniref:Histidine kinase domain-containing protein n=1 Tax=Mobilicoccus pelagius NBRC 104925 TaxID=1089455 RepID=H5US94_9MICO|nr:sensor histidine kinase [Mobilicoccus pelagius]GAB48602.1 hypothetical protein MOPEL_074_00890 [Mobilicoccus pelagius NBRC 104925]